MFTDAVIEEAGRSPPAISSVPWPPWLELHLRHRAHSQWPPYGPPDIPARCTRSPHAWSAKTAAGTQRAAIDGRSTELGLGLDVEVSVVGADRHEEVVQEALKPGQAERVGPWITEPDWRVPGELIGAVGHREADASWRTGGL